MKKVIAVLLSFCFGVFVLANGARGDSIIVFPGVPWEVEFKEYGRVFIMAVDIDGWWWNNHSASLEPQQKERLQMPSGLYYNTKPLMNIYHVDEEFEWGTVFFSNDGHYFVQMVRVHPSEPNFLNHEVLRFFAGGQLVASYQISDLVRSSHAVRASTSIVHWRGAGQIEHDQQLGLLSLETIEGRALTFDITTGEKINPDSIRYRLLGIMPELEALFRRVLSDRDVQ
ncbi:MAG: hypothetical protein FWE19_05890 [Oscillospiraceae bacterium]|nr:hypothetical protein [Oscillospiraceae bacterium]